MQNLQRAKETAKKQNKTEDNCVELQQSYRLITREKERKRNRESERERETTCHEIKFQKMLTKQINNENIRNAEM